MTGKISEMKKLPRPPSGLSREAAQWWQEVEDTYVLECSDYRVLTIGARSWDRAEQARRELKKHGLTYRDAHDVIRPHPAVLIEKNAMALFLKCVRDLRLPSASAPEISTGSNFPQRRVIR